MKFTEISAGRFPLLSLRLSTGCVHFGEGIKSLCLCEGFCEANSVGGLGKEEREGSLGNERKDGLCEEPRDRGFSGEQRARGLGEEETELCFGEGEGGKCLGELEKDVGLGEDLEGRGETSMWDCVKGLLLLLLLLAASPVAWMTLMCCWPASSTAVLELWRNRAVG